MSDVGNALRRLLSNYLLPTRGGRIIVSAVVVYATGSGLYLAGGTVFFIRGINLSNAQIGSGLTIAALAGFLTTVPVSMVARRIGPLQLLRAVQVWRAGSLAALAFADNLYTFTLFASAFAISQGPIFPMVQLVVSAVVGERQQTRSLGVIGSVSNVGMCLGALAAAPFLSIGSIWTFRAILLLGALCCLASSGLFGLLRVEASAPADKPVRWHNSLLPVGRDRRYLALTATSGVLFLHTVLLGVGLPLWLVQSTDAPAGLLSALITVNTMLAILLQVHFAKRVSSSRDGTRALRNAGYSLAAFSLVLVASTHTRHWLTISLLVLATVLLTCGELLQGVGGWELSYRHAPQALRTEYLSVFSLGGAATGIVGPGLLALALSWQTKGLLALCALFLTTSAAVAVLGRRLAHAEADKPDERPQLDKPETMNHPEPQEITISPQGKALYMHDQLLALIASVVDELNERRSEKIPTENLPSVVLYGDRGVFDSMHLVNFLVLVEEALEDEFDVAISLTSEKAVSRRVSPFGSVKRLIEFIEEEMRLATGEEHEMDDAASPLETVSR